MARSPAITVSQLVFTYSTRLKPALSKVSFTVLPGETVLVLGPSGAGKSTLTLCLDGLIPHLVEGDYEGTVTLAGLVVADTPVHVLAQQSGLVFQDPNAQFCTLTVEDEVAFGLENLCWPPEDIERSIDLALAQVGLTGYRARRLDMLSGGEKQRVALASVLAMGPKILVLDEPSANLDPQATSELFALLRQLAADSDRTLIIIEHKLDQLIEWVDTVLILDAEGRLIYQGDPRAVFYEQTVALEELGIWRPQTVELVLRLRELGWKVPGYPLGLEETVEALLATPGLGERMRNSSKTKRRPLCSQGKSFLQVKNLSYSYPGGRSALVDVSMSVPAGSFLAVAGVNGAGKSTLASLLAGAREAPPGCIFLDGVDLSGLRPAAVSEKVGLVFQNPEHQFVADTVFGELAFSLAPRAGRRRAGALTAEQRALVETWLERLGLLALAEANPFTLSQGQKRRLSVGSMLIKGQAVLVLDEPTLGQDEVQTRKLMAMMREVVAEGRSVIMLTHDMRLVAENATALLVLSQGRVAFWGEPARFFGEPQRVAEAGLAVPILGEVSRAVQRRASWPGNGGRCLESEAGSLAATEETGGIYTLAQFMDVLGPMRETALEGARA